MEYEGETSVYTQISPLKIRGENEYILIFPGEKLVYTHFSGGKNEYVTPAFLTTSDPNFIFRFESAIKEMVPDVILPYWDSTFERNMRIPELSVMFSEHFAGNGNGYVTTGPFQGFEGMKTGRLYRNLGQSIHGPISSMNAGNILRQMRTEQITFPTADLENSLEQAHNDVHDWVGGQMGKIDTSADDPLFFVHHCFIDYLWSLFRLKQKNNDIDPEFDYPEGADGEHHPLATMKPFQYFRNIHGYSDYWTSHVFKYEVSPYCSPDQPSCQSKWLTCDTVNWRCISAHTPFQTDIEKWIHNDFVINGIQNKEQWCYISVEIQYGTFSSNLQSSYFGSNMLDNTGTYQSNVFENADCIQKDRSKIDIYVEADGISYRGRYLDFVVLEKNKASATAYLKIAMANIDNSTTYISAYDSCGRICSPFCMVYNSNPPEYRPCSGVITNRRGPPNYCIKENANDYEHSLSFIKFYCDKSGTLRNIQDPNLNVELNHQKYHLL
jgi:tyrosinase